MLKYKESFQIWIDDTNDQILSIKKVEDSLKLISMV